MTSDNTLIFIMHASSSNGGTIGCAAVSLHSQAHRVGDRLSPLRPVAFELELDAAVRLADVRTLHLDKFCSGRLFWSGHCEMEREPTARIVAGPETLLPATREGAFKGGL
jgi:hypothetical protein